MFGPFKRKLTPRPSHAPGAPSVTQTATHIGDLGTWITQCPAVCRPPPGRTPAARSLWAERLGRAGDGWTPRRGCGTPRVQAASLPVKFVSSRDPSPAAHLWPREAWRRPGLCARSPGKTTSRRAFGAWRKGPGPKPSGIAGLAGHRGPAGGDRHLPELSAWASAARRDDLAETSGPRPRLRTGCELELAPEKQKPGDVGSAPSWPCSRRTELGNSHPCKENRSSK